MSMRSVGSALVVFLLFLLAAQDLCAQRRSSSRRSRSRSEKSQSPASVPATKAEVPWTQGDSPLSHFLWVARQIPDLSGFPSNMSTLSLQLVVMREKDVYFVDGCRFNRQKGFWKLDQCSSVHVDRKHPLGKLVHLQGELSPDPQVHSEVQELLNHLGSARRPAALEDHLNPAGSKGPGKGHALLDLMDADARQCGKRVWSRHLRALPKVNYIGEHVMMWSVTYLLGDGGGETSVTLGLIRTQQGWRISDLRVQCAPRQ